MIYHKKITNNEITISEIINDIEGLLYGKNNWNENNNNSSLGENEDDSNKFCKIDLNEDVNELDINSQSDVNEEEIKNLESKLNNMRFKDEEPIYIYTKMEKKRKAIRETIFDSLYINKSKK